ncbi:MAG: cardiolipin synthase [Polyangiaceae bacterium]
MIVLGAHVSWPTALAVLEVVYLVVLGAWILLEKRSPVATLAWLLSLFALPGVGFVVYFFLGPRKVRKRRLRRLRAEQATAKPTAHALDRAPEASLAIASDLVAMGQRAGGGRLSLATEIEILVDGATTYDALVAAIAAAQHHVHVLYYIFEPDETGRRLRDALVERARAGVRVRVLLDAVGSARTRHRPKFLRPLREAGAEIAYFNPPGVAQLVSRLLNFRNHRKIVVCDGRVGFTGGVNVTDEENPAVTKTAAWRDTHLRLVGPCVAWLQVVFLEDWAYARNVAFPASESAPYFPEVGDGKGAPVQIVDSGPDRDVEGIKAAYFSAINAAQRRVYLTSAYLVPDESMLFALETAALRGVDVRVLVPKRSDSRTAAAAARSYYDELLRAGVPVNEYAPRLLHAKTMVVDDAVAIVGTANFDNRSFRLNFEVTAVLFDAKATGRLAEIFERDLEHARLVTAGARRHVAFAGRLFEGTARLLSPVL